jgi:hypothetical protein
MSEIRTTLKCILFHFRTTSIFLGIFIVYWNVSGANLIIISNFYVLVHHIWMTKKWNFIVDGRSKTNYHSLFPKKKGYKLWNDCSLTSLLKYNFKFFKILLPFKSRKKCISSLIFIDIYLQVSREFHNTRQCTQLMYTQSVIKRSFKKFYSWMESADLLWAKIDVGKIKNIFSSRPKSKK